MTYPLEPTSDQMRAMSIAATEALARFIDGLDDAPSWDLSDAEASAALFREAAPDSGTAFETLLESVLEASAKAIETAGPGFFGFIPGGGIYASALAAYIAFAMNRFVNLRDAAPALAQIESTVLRWFADLFDLPADAGGLLTSGGSLANLSAIVTARSDRLDEDFLDGTIYTSEHAHHSVRKAAMLAGFPGRNVRVVPCDPDLRMDVQRFAEMVDRDAREGFRPFCVVATAGTTNTGTVDPLPAIADAARRRGMWFHVDAAYGGAFQLTSRGRSVLRGIESADSITLDPHKGLFLPYGTGALVVRDASALRAAHRIDADYMQDVHDDETIPSFMHHGPELSRDFRGLRVWLPIKLHGFGAFRDALDEKLDLARYVYEELSGSPGFDVPWAPDLTVVAFRYRFRNLDSDAGNRRLLDAINATRRVYLTSTSVAGAFTLRVCILSHRTHRDRVEECVDIIRRCASTLDR